MIFLLYYMIFLLYYMISHYVENKNIKMPLCVYKSILKLDVCNCITDLVITERVDRILLLR